MIRTDAVRRLPVRSPLAPQERLGVLGTDGDPLASASLWWEDTPALPVAGPVGVVGEYEARDDDAARLLLAECCRRLAAAGRAVAVGPMDRDTWHDYRFVTASGGAPRFAFEPENPPAYPAQWRAAGFGELARYRSVELSDLTVVDLRVAPAERRLAAEGVRIRNLDAGDLARELAALHRLVHVAFADNLLFKPISGEAFVDAFLPLAPLMRPGLVLVAEHESRPVALLWAFPDPSSRPEEATLVVKTAAVLPERRYAGLGVVLFQRVRHAAHRLGMRRGVVALMRDENFSRVTAERQGIAFRRYALFARRLDSR